MSDKINILIAEDELALGQIVKESLETRNFQVRLVADGEKAIKAFHEQMPHILVLDVMMPKKDGFTVARELRQLNGNIPIIFLTAKSQTSDVLKGFDSGGNDYLRKPFSMEELIVRINNLLNRHKLTEVGDIIKIGDYEFDFSRQTLKYKDEEKGLLTHREAHLLFHLCMNMNKVLDRSLILKKLWGDDDFFNTRSMDVFITKLRKKLKKDDNIRIINVRGYGYKLTF